MNDTKQTVLTDGEIEDWFTTLYEGFPACLYKEQATEFARRIESAVLSKLHGAGEPVAWRYQTATGWHATTDAGKTRVVGEHLTGGCLNWDDGEDSAKGAGDVLLPEPAAHLGKFPHKVSMYTADQVQAIVHAHQAATKGESNE